MTVIIFYQSRHNPYEKKIKTTTITHHFKYNLKKKRLFLSKKI